MWRNLTCKGRTDRRKLTWRWAESPFSCLSRCCCRRWPRWSCRLALPPACSADTPTHPYHLRTYNSTQKLVRLIMPKLQLQYDITRLELYKHFYKCLVHFIFNKDGNNGGLSTRCPEHSCSGHCDHRLDIHRKFSVFIQSSCFLCNNICYTALFFHWIDWGVQCCTWINLYRFRQP